MSQVVDNIRAVEIARDWLVVEMSNREDQASLENLVQIGQPPYTHAQYREFAPLVDSYGSSFDWPFWRLTLIALRALEYALLDYPLMLSGMTRGGKPLHQSGEMLQVNFIEEIPAIDVPVFFLHGALDYNTPLAFVEKYYQSLEAPHKYLIIFKNSAHTPFLAETEAFNQAVLSVKTMIDEN